MELLSGVPYADFLDERIFQPLGMTQTTFWPREQDAGRIPVPYGPTEAAIAAGAEAPAGAGWPSGGLRPGEIPQLTQPFWGVNRYAVPGGGLFSTAADCGRFCAMVINGGTFAGHRYLSPEATIEMLTIQTPENEPPSFGVGWAVWENGDFGHGGALGTAMNAYRHTRAVGGQGAPAGFGLGTLALVYLVHTHGRAPHWADPLAVWKKAVLTDWRPEAPEDGQRQVGLGAPR